MTKQQPSDSDRDDADEIQQRVSDVIDALSDPDTQKRLKILSKELVKLRASNAKPRKIKSQRKRAKRPGWVVKAVIEVMTGQTQPLHVVEIHELAEQHVGGPVSINSVNDVLATHCSGPEPLFIRVSRGRYVLAATEGK
jgi:DNA primase